MDELARQKYIDNWRTVRQIRYEDAMNRAYSQHHWTTAELNTLAHHLAPARLPRTEFNPQTGQIAWPSVLRDPQFAALRDQVNQLFAQRTAAAGLSAGGYRRLDMGINELSNVLKSRIREYPPDLYLVAKRFLGSLGYEATLSPETGPTATQIGAPRKHYGKGPLEPFRVWCGYRLENCVPRRSPRRPYFFRSFMRPSRVSSPLPRRTSSASGRRS